MRSKNLPTLKSGRIKVALTIGDPSGIGPAITLKAIRKLKNFCDITVIGDKWVLDQVTACGSWLKGTKFIDLKNIRRKSFAFGRVKPEYGRASIEYLDEALHLIKKRELDCLVTCPISKEAINKAGFHYSGHTEYLAKRSGSKNITMMLLNRYLKFSLVTRHISLRRVSGLINKESLRRAVVSIDEALEKFFLLKNPRIVVCGLNPHASDRGLIGNEELKVIEPELRRLRKKTNSRIDGPLPADVAIHRAREGEYDAVIAMYHDQALIPLKLSDPETGVNMTLGLPFVRTSPLHGTAFDIAGSFRKADPASLIEAIKLAVRCASNLKKA
jgi:4-hydroxythreonine-4-phosphate dehydrogenase